MIFSIIIITVSSHIIRTYLSSGSVLKSGDDPESLGAGAFRVLRFSLAQLKAQAKVVDRGQLMVDVSAVQAQVESPHRANASGGLLDWIAGPLLTGRSTEQITAVHLKAQSGLPSKQDRLTVRFGDFALNLTPSILEDVAFFLGHALSHRSRSEPVSLLLLLLLLLIVVVVTSSSSSSSSN